MLQNLKRDQNFRYNNQFLLYMTWENYTRFKKNVKDFIKIMLHQNIFRWWMDIFFETFDIFYHRSICLDCFTILVSSGCAMMAPNNNKTLIGNSPLHVDNIAWKAIKNLKNRYFQIFSFVINMRMGHHMGDKDWK